MTAIPLGFLAFQHLNLWPRYHLCITLRRIVPSLAKSQSCQAKAEVSFLQVRSVLSNVASSFYSLSKCTAGNLSVFDTPSKPFTSSASLSFANPSQEPRIPEFSSNGHKLAPINNNCKEWVKTPNVYINGLPANFREPQLLAIASPFGEVVSVRCFTRSTAKSPSGYGFVLCVLAYSRVLVSA